MKLTSEREITGDTVHRWIDRAIGYTFPTHIILTYIYKAKIETKKPVPTSVNIAELGKISHGQVLWSRTPSRPRSCALLKCLSGTIEDLMTGVKISTKIQHGSRWSTKPFGGTKLGNAALCWQLWWVERHHLWITLQHTRVIFIATSSTWQLIVEVWCFISQVCLWCSPPVNKDLWGPTGVTWTRTKFWEDNWLGSKFTYAPRSINERPVVVGYWLVDKVNGGKTTTNNNSWISGWVNIGNTAMWVIGCQIRFNDGVLSPRFFTKWMTIPIHG